MTKATLSKRNTRWFYFEIKAQSKRQARTLMEGMIGKGLHISIEKID
jgi:hypothetical protein